MTQQEWDKKMAGIRKTNKVLLNIQEGKLERTEEEWEAITLAGDNPDQSHPFSAALSQNESQFMNQHNDMRTHG